MNERLLLPLVALSCVGLAGLALSSLLILRLQAANEKRRRRVATTTLPYLPAGAGRAIELFRTNRRSRLGTLEHALGQAIGFDPARRDHYPAPWWVVLIVSLLIGRLVTGAVASLIGAAGVALTPVVAVVVCRKFFGWCSARRSHTLFRQMPDALAMIVRSVRVGIPMAEAIRTVAREARQPTAGEFTLLAERMMIGVGLEDALREMANRNDLAEYRFFATALSLQSQTGGGLTETLDNLADVIRKRVALQARGQALASEARTSAAVLVVLPIFSGAIIWFLNPSYIDQLFITLPGRKLFGLAVVFLIIGLAVMRSIVRRSLG